MQFTKKKQSPANKLAEYQEQGIPQLVSILEQKGSDYIVLNSQNNEITLASNRIFHLPARIPSQFTHRNQIVSYLRELIKESNKIKDKVSLDRAWEAFRNAHHEVTLEQIQRQIFPNQNLANFIAVRWALLSDKYYFKRGKTGFTPRPGESIESIKLAVAEEEQKWAKIKYWAETLSSNNPDTEALSLLKQVAALGKKQENWENAEKLLNLVNIETEHKRVEDRAFDLLVKLDVFTIHENLTPIKIGRPTVFTEEEIFAAKSLVANIDDSQKLDFDIFTIDGDETKDFDDALSLQISPSGEYCVGIHITNVSNYLSPGDLLWETSIKRSATVYTADQNYPMLPHIVSEEFFSLIEGKNKNTISVFVNFDKNLRFLNYEIKKNVISVTAKLTYNQLDKDFKNNTARGQLFALLKLSEKLEQGRIEKGAKLLPKREMLPVIDALGNVKLEVLNEETPARKLVGEMMILANYCMACYASKNQIPFIYRHQEKPDSSIEESFLPEGPAREYALRGMMKRSILSCLPATHYGLALDCYCQCTSPIRRAVDLINQYQINQYLNSNVPISTATLEKLIPELETKLGEVTYLQRKRHRYWLLAHLEQSKMKELEGTIVKTDGPKPLVELDNLFLISQFSPLKNKIPVVGSKVKLKLEQVSARIDRLKLTECNA